MNGVDLKISFSKISCIIFISILLGLIVNHFNPKGISLVREKLELKWAPDSLFNSLNQYSDPLKVDTSTKVISKLEDKVKETTKQPEEVTKADQNKVSEKKEITSDEKNGGLGQGLRGDALCRYPGR